jgi:hypothetical protein
MEPMSVEMNPSQAANVTSDPDVYDNGFLRIEHNSYYVSCNGTSLFLRIGRTNCVIATAFVGNAPPHAIPLVSYRWSAVYFLLIMTLISSLTEIRNTGSTWAEYQNGSLSGLSVLSVTLGK